HRRQVELDAGDLDAVGGEALLRLREGLARVEERLARDAADAEARAAERGRLLDDGDAHAELRGADGARVAAGAAADDDEIEPFARHQMSSSRRAGSSRRSFTRTRKLTACSPSTMRWSYESATYIIGRISIWSSTAIGRFWILCM